jgi:hypothetical protein
MVDRESSDIKGHLVETKTSRGQVENVTSYIEHHQIPLRPRESGPRLGTRTQAVEDRTRRHELRSDPWTKEQIQLGTDSVADPRGKRGPITLKIIECLLSKFRQVGFRP